MSAQLQRTDGNLLRATHCRAQAKTRVDSAMFPNTSTPSLVSSAAASRNSDTGADERSSGQVMHGSGGGRDWRDAVPSAPEPDEEFDLARLCSAMRVLEQSSSQQRVGSRQTVLPSPRPLPARSPDPVAWSGSQLKGPRTSDTACAAWKPSDSWFSKKSSTSTLPGDDRAQSDGSTPPLSGVSTSIYASGGSPSSRSAASGAEALRVPRPTWQTEVRSKSTDPVEPLVPAPNKGSFVNRFATPCLSPKSSRATLPASWPVERDALDGVRKGERDNLGGSLRVRRDAQKMDAWIQRVITRGERSPGQTSTPSRAERSLENSPLSQQRTSFSLEANEGPGPSRPLSMSPRLEPVTPARPHADSAPLLCGRDEAAGGPTRLVPLSRTVDAGTPSEPLHKAGFSHGDDDLVVGKSSYPAFVGVASQREHSPSPAQSRQLDSGAVVDPTQAQVCSLTTVGEDRSQEDEPEQPCMYEDADEVCQVRVMDVGPFLGGDVRSQVADVTSALSGPLGDASPLASPVSTPHSSPKRQHASPMLPRVEDELVTPAGLSLVVNLSGDVLGTVSISASQDVESVCREFVATHRLREIFLAPLVAHAQQLFDAGGLCSEVDIIDLI